MPSIAASSLYSQVENICVNEVKCNIDVCRLGDIQQSDGGGAQRTTIHTYKVKAFIHQFINESLCMSES